jgi:LmbE family N-acetylglucosaminyl deacetylase
MTAAEVRSHVVVSPHPDDAVWSVGGRIARWVAAGEQVTVVTVFDGAGAVLPGAWRSVAEPYARRAEDIRALSHLGARRVSVGLPDAALRAEDGVPRYASRLQLFGRPHEADRVLTSTLAGVLRELCGPGVLLHSPLAAGRHVDHVLVRRAVGLLAGATRSVRYYEDFPYRLRAADHAGLTVRYEPVDLSTWLAAAHRYPTQVAALFGSVARFDRALVGRARIYGRLAGLQHADREWAQSAAADSEMTVGTAYPNSAALLARGTAGYGDY